MIVVGMVETIKNTFHNDLAAFTSLSKVLRLNVSSHIDSDDVLRFRSARQRSGREAID